MNNIQLSIIIPVYNETNRIEKTLIHLSEHLKKLNISYEIIIVNDGSTDNTCAIITSLNLDNTSILHNERNSGKGYSVRNGLKHAKGSNILFMDADGSTDICAIKLFLSYMNKGYDLLIASRYLPDSIIPIPQSKWRIFTAKVFRKLIKLLFNFPLSDTQCGFKMFSKSCLATILPYLQENGFVFDIEIIYYAYLFKQQVKELPVTWTDDPESKVTFLKGPVKMTLRIINFRIQTLIRKIKFS